MNTCLSTAFIALCSCETGRSA